MSDDPYAVLGVDRSTDLAQIRRVYLAELRANHPDLRPGDEAAEQRTRDLNRAWEHLRRRDGVTVGAAAAARTVPRPPQPAYSDDQRDFRTAFTAATLRIALVVLALGLVLLVALGR